MTPGELERKPLLLTCLLLAFFSLAAFAQEKNVTTLNKVANADDFARDGRRLYYNLRSEGLVRYRCALNPDWDLFFSKLNLARSEAEARREQLKKVKFQFALGSANDVQLTHADAEVSTEEEQRRMYQMYSGMDQMMHGFFRVWSEFMLHNFFDGVTSKDVVFDDGDSYRIEGDHDNSHGVVVFGKDYVIREVRASTPEYSGKVTPTFSSGPKGLMLTSFSATYKPPTAPEGNLHATISYQPVNGFQLPKQVLFGIETGNQKISISFAFDNCTADKR